MRKAFKLVKCHYLSTSIWLLLFMFLFLTIPVFSANDGIENQQNTEVSSKDAINLDKQLPITPEVKIGKLNNGLMYYIRENHKPENRAELRLVVNAGSILEDEDQQGLAHFVEHMAFNGTEEFEKYELINFLESFGMRMGPDLNAYTSFDETVYKLQVPTDSAHLFETAFQILREWSSNLAFNPEEVDKERGVVIEEWRLGRGASARIREKQFPILFKGSRYAERLPIGKKEVLQNFEYETLKRFYREWYRPNLMAVVAVGDFQTSRVEELITQHFKDLSAHENPPPRETYAVPDHKEPLFAIATDPEASQSSITLVFKHPKEKQNTIADYREMITQRLYNSMVNERLQELTQSADPPFIFASSGKGSFVRSKDLYTLGAMVPESGFTRALRVLLIEAERVNKFGFTESELAREKRKLLRRMEKTYKERDKTESSRYASEYIRNFLEDEPIPGIVFEYKKTQKLLPDVETEDVNTLTSRLITDSNRVVLVSGPEKEGVKVPTEQDLKAVFEQVRSLEIEPYEDKVSDEPLLAKVPEPVEILEETYDDRIDVTRLTLANSVEVVLKPTQFKNDQILFSAHSPGGTSLAADSVYTSTDFASVMVNQSGVGDFGPIALKKKLAGQVVSVSPVIHSLSEGFRGSASPQDLETLFQLVYLYFDAPRIDSTAYASYKKRLGDYIANMALNPVSAFEDTVQVTMAQHHYRRRPLTQKILDELEMGESFQFYRNRFADAGDFIFYFVGNFDVDEMKSLGKTYLGNLPSINRDEKWQDVGIRPPSGIVSKAVYRGMEPKTRVKLVFTGPFDWSQQNRRLIQAMTDILKLQFRDVLREELGGTYGARVSTSTSEYPYPHYRTDIDFGCDPERVEEMTKTVFTQIDSLQDVGPVEKDLMKVKEQAIREHEKDVKENAYWLNLLKFYDRHGEDPVAIKNGPKSFMQSLTAKMIRHAAQQYLNEDNYVKVVLFPENQEGD